MSAGAEGTDVVRKILTGDFHPALEKALLDHLVKGVRAAPLGPIPVVVPTNLLGLRLSRALADRMGGHAGVRFMTLKDFAASVAPTPLPDDRATLPPHADRIVVRRLIDQGTASGGYFEAIADRPGLSAVILASMRDLKEACYNPASFAAAARGTGLLRRARRNKLAELARIWNAYETRLASERWADDLDLMRVAVETLESDETARPPLALYGFYDLNSLQKCLVASYVERAGAVVFFPYGDAEGFAYARSTLDWFLSMGFEQEPCAEADVRALPLPKETIIVSAPGEAREVREDARVLARVLEERDLSFQDVAVVMRSSDTYSDLFSEELPHIRARPYLEKPAPLSRTRTGRSLIKLALAAQSDFARSDVMEFLSLADLDTSLPGSTERGAPVSDWNAAAMLAGVTAGADGWIERLRALGTRIEEGEPGDGFADAHRRFAAPIGSLVAVLEDLLPELGEMPGRATVSEFLDHLIGVFGRLTRETDERAEILAATDKMRPLSSIAGAIQFSYFVELLRACLDAPKRRERKFGRGGPTVLNIMAARGLSRKIVIIPGLVEREFPSRRRQDPILLDGERERLNRSSGNDPLMTLPLRAVGIEEEKLLFRLAVSAATDVAILSYPRLDPATARPRVPSIFVLDTLRELTGKSHSYDELETSNRIVRVPLSRRFPAHRTEALTESEFDGCSILEAVATGRAAEVAYLVRENGPLARRLKMEEARWGSPFFTSFDGALISDQALAAAEELSGLSRDGLRPGRTVSATALEDYAICPFRFLVRHVLDIEPLEEPEDALHLSPKDRGSLYHAVLERFLSRMREDGRLPLDASCLDDLLATAERLTRSGPWDLAGFRGARLLELQELVLSVSLWFAGELRDESGLVPSYFEARFGGRTRRHDDQELSIEEGVPFDALGGVRVEFAGKIDRIDVSRDGARARVIDYKTGRPPKGRKVFDGGRRLQLPIYVLAARKMLADRHPGAIVEAAEYRYVAAREGKKTLSFTSGELDERSAELAEAIGLIVKGITSGMFFPWPGDATCRYCDYADACASTSLALAEMKIGDRRAAFFVEGLARVE